MKILEKHRALSLSLIAVAILAAGMAAHYYDSAVTMSLGHVTHADPWLLPRIPLYPENSPFFARVKILLKCNSFGTDRPREVAA